MYIKEEYNNYSVINGETTEEIEFNIDIKNNFNEVCEECKRTNKNLNNYCTYCGNLLNG